MLLELSTWPQIAAYLKHHSGVIVPIGSIEQHGPSGALATDALCAQAIARGVGERYAVLIAPTLMFGVAQFNLGFPGTIALRSSTLMAVADDIIQSLHSYGLTRIYFLNGHGGNIAPLKALFQDIYWPYSISARAAPLRCRLRSWWEYPRTDELRQTLFGSGEGLHATPSEIALTQHVYGIAPRSTGLTPLAPLGAEFIRDHGGDNHYDASHHKAQYKDGRIGSRPELATPELGEQLLKTAIVEAYADYQQFLAD